MKRKLSFILLLFFFCISIGSYAQLNYSFTASSGAYTANSSPTSLLTNGDEVLTSATNIGFNFQFGCSTYTQFIASSNGWLTFNTAATSANLTNSLDPTGDFNSPSDRPIIAPLWDDLAINGSINYLLTGTAPNRVLTVEWKGMLWNYAAAGSVISFQVKLYETSNRIQFVYTRNGTAVNNGSASIGIGTSTTGDFYSLNGVGAAPTANYGTETSTLSTKPATGQIYQWDPVTCSGTPTAGTATASVSNVCTGQSTVLSLSGSSVGGGCGGVTYQWQSSPDNSTWTNISGATSSTYMASPTVLTYYQCIVTCSGNSATSSSAGVSVSSCILQATNTVTISSCPTTLNFYDSGGPNVGYSANQDYTLTVKAPAGSCLTVSFSSLYTESCCDYLTIYDGSTTAATSLGTYSGTTTPPTITSTGTSLTFYFYSDFSTNYDGWVGSISCLNTCSGTPTAGTAAASSACGNLSLSLSGNTTGCGIGYQWQSSTNSGTSWSNVSGATSSSFTTATPGSNTCYRCNVTCSGNTATSTSVCSASASGYTCNLNYSYSTTTYSLETTGVTTAITGSSDDYLSNAVPLGFTFCFDSYMYTQAYVATNAALVFDEVNTCAPNVAKPRAAAGNNVWTGYQINAAIPTTIDYTPQNAILAPWHDIDINNGGTITYATLGTAPNRRFIVYFKKVYQFETSSPCNQASYAYTGEIKLFESSNIIEIHVNNEASCSLWNGGYAILGLHNPFGTFAVVPTGYNYPSIYNITNTAWKFTSNCTSCMAILPIDMLSFDVSVKDETSNRIKFVTSKEVNVNQFHIERSIDGKHFDLVSYVKPKGPNGATYELSDVIPTIDTYYYRVGTEDKNGEIHYSGIRVAQRGKVEKTAVLRVYPNPFENNFNIEIESAGSNNATIEVIDAIGRKVYSESKVLNDGTNSFPINLISASKGLLLFKVTNDNGEVIYQTKLVQQ